MFIGHLGSVLVLQSQRCAHSACPMSRTTHIKTHRYHSAGCRCCVHQSLHDLINCTFTSLEIAAANGSAIRGSVAWAHCQFACSLAPDGFTLQFFMRMTFLI